MSDGVSSGIAICDNHSFNLKQLRLFFFSQTKLFKELLNYCILSSPYRYRSVLRRCRRNFALQYDRRQRGGHLLLARTAAAAAVGRQAEDRSGGDGGEVGSDVILRDAVAAEVLERSGTVGCRGEMRSTQRPENLTYCICITGTLHCNIVARRNIGKV